MCQKRGEPPERCPFGFPTNFKKGGSFLQWPWGKKGPPTPSTTAGFTEFPLELPLFEVKTEMEETLKKGSTTQCRTVCCMHPWLALTISHKSLMGYPRQCGQDASLKQAQHPSRKGVHKTTPTGKCTERLKAGGLVLQIWSNPVETRDAEKKQKYLVSP